MEKIKGDIVDKPVVPNGEEKEGSLSFITAYMQDGNTYFFITVDGVDYEISIKTKGAKQLLKASVNDTVKIRIDGGAVTEVISVTKNS